MPMQSPSAMPPAPPPRQAVPAPEAASQAAPAAASDDGLWSPNAPRPLEWKAALLVLFTLVLVLASVVYVLYARGAFEPTQRLVLTTDDSEGVTVGMNLTFSGFPIGRVRSVDLDKEGGVRITIDVPRRDAHRLRTSSVFTLVRGLVGGTQIRAYTGVPTDPQLTDGAEVAVLRGDATADIPKVTASVKDLLDNLNRMTDKGGALARTLDNFDKLSEKMSGPRGALSVLVGNDEDARKLVVALDRTNALLARLDGVAAKADTLVGSTNGLVNNANNQVFGTQGLTNDVQTTVKTLNNLLGDTRNTLKEVDGVLREVQGIGANVKGATTDLAPLRNDVEANMRKIEGMINDINRRWPFAKDAEVKLP
jgi:phospholipid/cholesterol/gamma-HCH transport system substrate-binding protein